MPKQMVADMEENLRFCGSSAREDQVLRVRLDLLTEFANQRNRPSDINCLLTMILIPSLCRVL